jgi:hypothetical protein
MSPGPITQAGPADSPHMISPINSAMSGMANAVNRLGRASADIAKPEPDDLIGDRVDQITAEHDFKANLTTVRTADEMLGTVIDILA